MLQHAGTVPLPLRCTGSRCGGWGGLGELSDGSFYMGKRRNRPDDLQAQWPRTPQHSIRTPRVRAMVLVCFKCPAGYFLEVLSPRTEWPCFVSVATG